MQSITTVPGADPTDVVGRRVVSALIDLGVPAVLSIVLNFAVQGSLFFGPQFGTTSGLDGTAAAVTLFLYAFQLVWWIGNLALLRGIKGSSLGQRAVGLVTVTEDGQVLGGGMGFVRTLLGVVDGAPWCCYLYLVGLITMLSSKKHQRVADMVVKSFVVDKALLGTPIFGTWGNFGVGPYAQSVGDLAPPPGQPQWDPTRNSWVTVDPATGTWYRFDQTTNTWLPL